MIHIGRAGTRLGSFSVEEVLRGLHTGRFSWTDLGWKEGMENWVPLSEFSELTLPPPIPPLPEQEPADAGPQAEAPVALPPAGLPWDHRHEIGLVRAFAETARMILMNPSQAFARMLIEGSLSNPFLYNMIGGWIGLIANGIYACILARAEQAPTDPNSIQAHFYQTPAMTLSALKLAVVMGPVFVTVFSLVGAFIAHMFLMLAGGANKPYHVTLRVFCYGVGSAQLLQLVPFCGAPLVLVWLLVCCVVGLTIAHGTTTGRAVSAMVLFLAASMACCVGMILIAMSGDYQGLAH